MNEKIILAEIYNQDGRLGINIPNEKDTKQYELYGFLKCYLKLLEEDLIIQIQPIDENGEEI